MPNPIGDADRWQRIVENLAALVAELDRGFVPRIEAAARGLRRSGISRSPDRHDSNPPGKLCFHAGTKLAVPDGRDGARPRRIPRGTG
jgi:hypothetical protein